MSPSANNSAHTGVSTRRELFTALEGGYYHYRVPSCVVSAVSADAESVALVFAEARKNSRGGEQVVHNDYWDIDILLRRSIDGGQSWGDRQLVVDHADFGDGPIHNFVPITDSIAPHENGGRGCIHALFNHDYSRLFYIRSEDDGATWSRPRDMTFVAESIRPRYPWTAIAIGPGHGVCKSIPPARGRLVVPLWMCATKKGEGDPHRPSDVTMIYSDDHGQTWQAGPTIAANDQPATGGTAMGTPNETSPTELADGSVMFNIRNESKPPRRLVAISADGLNDWTQPRFDEALFDPQCHGSLISLTSSGGEADRSGASSGGTFAPPLNGRSTPASNADGSATVDHSTTDTAGVLQELGNKQQTKLLFVAPDSQTRDMPGNWDNSYDRKNLTARISRDSGNTWEILKVIEPGPSGYSDLAALPGGRAMCVFECGMIEKMSHIRSIAVEIFEA